MTTVALLATSMICLLAVMANIRLRLAIARARDEADHDPLTGLLRRHVAREHLAQRRTSGQSTTAILLDMDDFKRINDRHGHLAGDQLLATVGVRLAAYARRLDGSATRLGGDEFLLLVPALTPVDHIAQTEAILDDLALPITADSHVGVVTLKPSATAGIATGTASDDWTHLMRTADIALYQAKQADTRYCYDASSNSTATPLPTSCVRRRLRSSSNESEALTRSTSQTGPATRRRESRGYWLGGEAGSGTELAIFPRWEHRPHQTIAVDPVTPQSSPARGQHSPHSPAHPGTREAGQFYPSPGRHPLNGNRSPQDV